MSRRGRGLFPEYSRARERRAGEAICGLGAAAGAGRPRPHRCRLRTHPGSLWRTCHQVRRGWPYLLAPKLRTWASLQRKRDRIPDPECSWDESYMQLRICSWDFWGRGWKVVGALGREKPSSDTLLAGQRDSMSKSRLSYGRPRWDLRLSRPGGSGLEVARSLRPPDGAPRHRAVGVCHLWGVHGRFRRRQAFGPVNSAEPGASPVTQPASGCAKPEARTDIHLPAAGHRPPSPRPRQPPTPGPGWHRPPVCPAGGSRGTPRPPEPRSQPLRRLCLLSIRGTLTHPGPAGCMITHGRR